MEAEDLNISVFQGNAYYSVFDENSDSSKTIVKLISQILAANVQLDNSDKYVLDLGGGNGFYGLYIKNLLKAKKVIVYEPNLSMIETGKVKFSKELDSIEYVSSKMEAVLLNDTHMKHEYCCVLSKESMHFTNSEFFESLLSFCDTNLKGKLILLGAPNYKYWTKEPCLPTSAIKAIGDINFDVIFCKDLMCKRYEKREISKKTELLLEDISFKFSLLQYESFMINRSWSYLLNTSDLEIIQTIEKVKQKLLETGDNEIIIVVTYGFLSADF